LHWQHVQEHPPFSLGCIGPNADGSLVTVQQCRAVNAAACSETASIQIFVVKQADGSSRTVPYQPDCPCWDNSQCGLNGAGLNVGNVAAGRAWHTRVYAGGAWGAGASGTFADHADGSLNGGLAIVELPAIAAAAGASTPGAAAAALLASASSCDVVMYGYETGTTWLSGTHGLFMPIGGSAQYGGKQAYQKGSFFLYYTSADREWNVGKTLGSHDGVWAFVASNASSPELVTGIWQAAYGTTKHISDGPAASMFTACKPCDVVVSDPGVTVNSSGVVTSQLLGLYMAVHRGFAQRVTYQNAQGQHLFYGAPAPGGTYGTWNIGSTVGDPNPHAKSSAVGFNESTGPADAGPWYFNTGVANFTDFTDGDAPCEDSPTWAWYASDDYKCSAYVNFQDDCGTDTDANGVTAEVACPLSCGKCVPLVGPPANYELAQPSLSAVLCEDQQLWANVTDPAYRLQVVCQTTTITAHLLAALSKCHSPTALACTIPDYVSSFFFSFFSRGTSTAST
jgi:hypothetical protein